MYEEHPIFNPPNDDATLWRYMDFTKFVSLLDTKSLFFARADKLGDPFEGAPPKLNADMRAVESIELRKQLPDDSASTIIEMRSTTDELRRSWTLVNCWHESDYESAAMWRLYSREHDGIAVKTNFKSLADSFTCSESIFIGKVEYIDYDTECIQERNAFAHYLHKRHSFEHEKEVRAITVGDFELVKSRRIRVAQGRHETGAYYTVDISHLIKEVVVAPYADKWFMELVQSVASRYGMTGPVSQSRLSEAPRWG